MIPSALESIVQSRFSVRRYDERPIPEEHVRSMVEAARLAPSAENSQPSRFIAVTSQAALERVSRACFSGIFRPTRRNRSSIASNIDPS